MQIKIQGKTITVPASKLDEIRAAYSDTEHIALTEPRIRVVLRKKTPQRHQRKQPNKNESKNVRF